MTTAFEQSEKTEREPEGRVRRTELPEAGRTNDIETQIKEMEEMKLPDLQQHFAKVVGEETKAPNKKYLIKRIVEVLEREGLEQDDIAEDKQDELSQEDTEDTYDLFFNDEVNDSDAFTEINGGKVAPVVAEDITEGSITEDTTRLSQLDVDALRDKYSEIVGRPTCSGDKRYLIWKIRQAQQGKIPVGPIARRSSVDNGGDCKVLPVRLEAKLVEQIDEAWRRHDLKSRMELFRRALLVYMQEKGEAEIVAALSA